MYNDITIFTVDCGETPLEEIKRYKFCIDRWKEILPKNVTLKIFTKEDQIVKDCLEEFKDYFKLVEENCKTNYKYAFMSDVIRLYILSKNKNFLYLDADIYIEDSSFLNILGKEAIANDNRTFAFLWSGEEPEKFKPFLDYYKEVGNEKKQREIKNDAEVTIYLEEQKKINIINYCNIEGNNMIHLVSGIFKDNCTFVFFQTTDFSIKLNSILKIKLDNLKIITKSCKENINEVNKKLKSQADLYNTIFFSNNFALIKHLIENTTDGYKIIDL